MFIKNIHVSLFSINLCLENGPGKSVFENVFVKYTKYGGSNTNTNTNTWFEIWSKTNTNTNTPYLYLYLYLQIQIRIWPQPWNQHWITVNWTVAKNVNETSIEILNFHWRKCISRSVREMMAILSLPPCVNGWALIILPGTTVSAGSEHPSTPNLMRTPPLVVCAFTRM